MACTQVSLHIYQVDSTKVDAEGEDFGSFMAYNREAAYGKVDSLREAYRRQGYLAFSVDEIETEDSTVVAHIFVGHPYLFSEVQVDSSEQVLLDEIRFQNSQMDNLLLTESNMKFITDKILGYLENNGYPFAEVKFTDWSLDGGQVKAKLSIDRNQIIFIDSLNITGPVKISASYLEKYLGIKRGDAYNNKAILNIPRKLKDLRFLALESNPSVLFVNKKAVINLPTKKSKSSSFDFLIGLLRTNDTDGGQYIITGEFTTELLNKLGYGESMFIQLRRLRPETQELNLRVNYPYPFDVPFGIDGSLELYRNALDFLDFNAALGLRYIWDGNSHLKVFYNQSSNYLLEVDTISILNSQRLPQRLDVSYSSLGLELQHNSLDYKYNPSRGVFLNLSGQAGIKKTVDNQKITSLSNEFVDFTDAYDTLNLRTYQFQINNDISYYIPLANNLSFKLANNGGLMFGGDKIYQNEFFRIGGNRLLRGFDEQSITASFYSVFSFELRFILAQENNNFTLSLPFVDYGIIYNPLDLELAWDQALGVGVGMNFETGAGLFNFAIASGQRNEQAFDFNNLKIHFGYVNLF